MAAEQSYTYAEATAAAETRIRELMESATASQATNLKAAQAYRDWAYGVYLGWLHLTGTSEQQEADVDRLESLTVHRAKG